MNYTAYFGIKYYKDNSNKSKIDSIAGALLSEGIETICVARDIGKWGAVKLSSQELMSLTFNEIDKSDFVILEMTEKGVGLGIEAGYAIAKQKPLVVLIKRELELSNTMKGIANFVIPYQRPEDIKILKHNKSLQQSLASLRK